MIFYDDHDKNGDSAYDADDDDDVDNNTFFYISFLQSDELSNCSLCQTSVCPQNCLQLCTLKCPENYYGSDLMCETPATSTTTITTATLTTPTNQTTETNQTTPTNQTTETTPTAESTLHPPPYPAAGRLDGQTPEPPSGKRRRRQAAGGIISDLLWLIKQHFHCA